MPEQETVEAAKRDLAEGKSASTAAGEFVRQEIDHVREGRHGAANTKQAIAIGLSEARRAGILLKAPGKGQSAATRKKAAQDSARGRKKPATRGSSNKRGRATEKALRKQPKNTASRAALSKQAKGAAKKRSASSRSAAAKKAAKTRRRGR